MEQINDKERVIIVCWKWKNFAEAPKKPILHEGFWDVSDNQELLEDVEIAFDRKLIDKYQVALKTEDKTELVQPFAKVVRVFIEHCDNGMLFLENLVAYFANEKTRIFVFLHRGEGFLRPSVHQILDKTAADKCFLFSGGQDYIYHQTQNEGMLGEDGTFFSQKPRNNSPEIKVADAKKKLVFQPHFDKVWYYYEHEFDNKTFELKEDILTYLLPYYEDRRADSADFIQCLGSNRALYLRTKSFITDLEVEERKELTQIEKVAEKSYVFDDFRSNLKKMNRTAIREYEEASQLIEKLFFKPSNLSDKTIKEYLRDLEKEMNDLIWVLKQKN